MTNTANYTAAPHPYQISIENIKAMLQRLQNEAENDFGIIASEADFHATIMAGRIERNLKDVCDSVFCEGDYSKAQVAS